MRIEFVKLVKLVELVKLVKLVKLVIGNWMLVTLLSLMAVAQGQDTSYFGEISVESDSTIESKNFNHFLKISRSNIFNEENYKALTEQILQIPISEGFLYPLLTLEKISPTKLNDSLFVNPDFKLSWGNEVFIDTLFYGSIKKTSPKLLEKDLTFLKHQKYSESMESEIKQALQKYEFLVYENNEIVKSKNGKYGLLINLKENQANKFAGVAGYVPKTSSTKGYFTGQIDIDLKNISGKGRGINIFWSKVNENSQELELGYFEPHLLRTSIFSNIGFNQTLRDTLVIIRDTELGFGKNLSGKGTIELTANYETTLPTSSGEELLGLEKTKILKAGLNYQFDNRDLASNPSRGFYLNTHNYLGYYEKQDSKTLLVQTEFYAENNFSLSKQLILHLKADYQGKYLRNGTIDYADQIWFGGATSLRGYAEDLFAGKEVGIFGGELRWITGYYSRIFVFMDQGYYKSLDNEMNFPFSFGIGMRLESRMGTIGLDYAFGEDDTFTTAKIHIHLENRF